MHNGSVLADDGQSSMTLHWLLPFLQLIVSVYIISPLTLVGLICNAINVLIFSRLNQRQTININLLAMAISDLTGLLGMFFTSVCFYPVVLQSKDVPFISQDIHFLTGTCLFAICRTNTANLTFIVCAERCLCILLPLKVKTLVTVGRIRALIVGSWLWSIGVHSIAFYGYQFVWKFAVDKNRTALGITLVANRKYVMEISQIAINIFNQYIVFVGVIILTMILVVKLRQQSKWRQTSGQSVASELSAKRDTKVAKTVCVIATIFILCYFPDSVSFTLTLIIPGFYLGGPHHEILSFIFSLAFMFVSINSSVNIIVYLKFNSQYRKEFGRLFGCCTKREAGGEMRNNEKKSTTN